MEEGSEAQPMAVAMDLPTALKEVLKKARVADGLVRGLREVTKLLDRREAQLCILAEDCDEEAYVRLIEALCREHGIPLLKVSSKEELGVMAGLYKMDTDGSIRKSVKCSSVAIRDFGEVTEAVNVVKQVISK